MAAQAPKEVFIKAGKLFDSAKGVLVSNQIIQVKGNVIENVGSNLTIPQHGNFHIIAVARAFIAPTDHMFVAKASAQGIHVMEGTEILRLCRSILIAAIYRAVCFGAQANLSEQKNERQHKMAHQIKERR